MKTLKDSEGNELEIGAMYCCTFIQPDANGDFHDDNGIWIARKVDNQNHKAFAS